VATTGIPARRPSAPPPPAPGAKEPEAAPPIAQPVWTVGQARRCLVHVEVEGLIRLMMQFVMIDIMQRLDMTWRVTAIEGDRVVLEAKIDQFAITSTGTPPEGSMSNLNWNVSYDSQREADTTSPFHPVVGASLKLIVDATTGRVVELQGADVVQDLVTARAAAGAGTEWRERLRANFLYQVPLLAEVDALRETLNGGLHVYPDTGRPGARRWALQRAPDLTGGTVWPSGCTAEVAMVADDKVVRWTGKREATFKAQWPPKAQGILERLVKGTATLSPDERRVVSASFQESWKTSIVGQETGGTRGVYDIKVDLTDLP
jgi:hypothetical protein